MEREVLKTINHSCKTLKLHILILPILVNEKKNGVKKTKNSQLFLTAFCAKINHLNSRDIFDIELKVCYKRVGGLVGEYNRRLPRRDVLESIKRNVCLPPFNGH